MRLVDLSLKSRPVVVVPYDARWPAEFDELARRLDRILEEEALRIDHIGSTSVPGLCAKDLVDVQITVRSLDSRDAFVERMASHGYRERTGPHVVDVYEDLADPTSPELRKRYFREPEGEKRVHLHVREAGRFNQRYALLFRDFLRSNAAARRAYGEVKQRAAKIFPENIDGYLFIKEPVMDLIFQSAERWALETSWGQKTTPE